MVNSLSRSRFGSQRRASAVVNASSWSRRSGHRRGLPGRTRGGSARGRAAAGWQGRCPRRPGCGPRSAPGAVAKIEVGQLAAGSADRVLVRERGDPVAVVVGDPQLGAGMGTFPADDDPPSQVQHANEFGDEGAVADLTVGVVGRDQALSGSWAISCPAPEGSVNPTEYASRRRTSQFTYSWVAPSTLTSTLRPGPPSPDRPGNWANAWRVTLT